MTARRRRLLFAHLFAIYFLAGAAETYISPLFPLMRHELGLAVSDQATLIAFLTVSIAIGNIVGGWLGVRVGDQLAIRLAAALLAVGTATSGLAHGYAVLIIGQTVSGLGVGLFFGPGLAMVGRLYPASRGRAIASYGLAYSLGLAAAAFAAGLGSSHWRLAFLATTALSGLLCVVLPKLPAAEPLASSGGAGLFLEAVRYTRNQSYRAALAVGAAAGIGNYVLIGLTPEHFVARGVSVGLVAGLVGAGRIASMAGKYVSGWLVDRIGGSHTARYLTIGMGVFGALNLALPGQAGLWAVPPFVCVTAMLFPVSNAMIVGALAARVSWGIGIYRACLMIVSALCAAAVGACLRVANTTVVMCAALVLALAIVLIGRGRTKDDDRTTVEVATSTRVGGAMSEIEDVR
jgi:predicted MFS family arabinose efflux permease